MIRRNVDLTGVDQAFWDTLVERPGTAESLSQIFEWGSSSPCDSEAPRSVDATGSGEQSWTLAAPAADLAFDDTYAHLGLSPELSQHELPPLLLAPLHSFDSAPANEASNVLELSGFSANPAQGFTRSSPRMDDLNPSPSWLSASICGSDTTCSDNSAESPASPPPLLRKPLELPAMEAAADTITSSSTMDPTEPIHRYPRRRATVNIEPDLAKQKPKSPAHHELPSSRYAAALRWVHTLKLNPAQLREDELFRCPFCGHKSTSKHSNKVDHLYTHAPKSFRPKRLACSECEETYAHLRSLRRHQKAKHGGIVDA